MTHINYETLVNYLENNLTQAEMEKVQKHIYQPCERCNARINRLRSVFSITAADRSVAPSPATFQKAVALFQQRSHIPLNPIQRILAALQFDSRLQLSPAAFRGIARSRQLLFSAQDVDIDLQLTPEQSGQSLKGQVIGSSSGRAFVSLQTKAGDLLDGTETDLQGQFDFRQVEPGVYDLVFDIENQEITISDLAITND